MITEETNVKSMLLFTGELRFCNRIERDLRQREQAEIRVDKLWKKVEENPLKVRESCANLRFSIAIGKYNVAIQLLDKLEDVQRTAGISLFDQIASR